MPANVVKTPADERRWNECKHFYQKKGFTGTRLYKAAMACFQKRKANAAK